MFKVGDKVVCIKCETAPNLKIGEVYTVKERIGVFLSFRETGDYAYKCTLFELCTKETRRGVDLKASETMIGGTHYTSMGIQPFEFTYANYGYMGLKAAVHTKVNKYLGRVKDNEIEQLKKAKHCIEVLIEKAELEAAK